MGRHLTPVAMDIAPHRNLDQLTPFVIGFVHPGAVDEHGWGASCAAVRTHTGNYYADVDNGRGQIAPSTANNDRQGLVNRLNASLSWNSRDDRWQILAWGKNLTGVRYWSYAQENGFETQYSAAPPRTFGATFSRHW
jgi:outer membrane receptor protein involved in Fe transport